MQKSIFNKLGICLAVVLIISEGCYLNKVGQIENDKPIYCDSILNSIIEQPVEKIVQNLFNITLCSQGIDSFDVTCLGPIFSQFLFDEEKTYRAFLIEIDSFKNTDNYLAIRNQLYPDYYLKNKIAKITEWEKDKDLFKSIGATDKFLKLYEIHLKENCDNIKTHKILCEEMKKIYPEL